MIPVKKNGKKVPASLKSAACQANLTSVVASGDKSQLRNYYAKPDVVLRLNKLYNKKCAYCETFEPSPQIEHYRPKKRVHNSRHGGYYWLAYEWSNLLPACYDCNKTGVKGNHFPIEGLRISTPVLLSGRLCTKSCKTTSSALSAEKPLFLNPETPGFSPFNYFKFDEVGEMQEAPPPTSFEFRQAKQTIKIVALNRDKLFANYRLVWINHYKNRINLTLLQFLAKNLTESGIKTFYFDILQEIRAKCKVKHEYSFFWSFIYLNWDMYVKSFLLPVHHQRFLDYTIEFKKINK